MNANPPASAKLNSPTLWRTVYWGAAVLLIVAAALATRFTREMNWGAEDFAFVGVMFGTTGLLLELVLRSSDRLAYRIGAAIGIGTAFLTIWINAAVGIIGSDDNPANLLFGVVLAIAMAGSLVAGFHPRGLARAMRVTAGAQVMAFLLAWAWGDGFIPGITLVFTALWLASAALFAQASRAAGQ